MDAEKDLQRQRAQQLAAVRKGYRALSGCQRIQGLPSQVGNLHRAGAQTAIASTPQAEPGSQQIPEPDLDCGKRAWLRLHAGQLPALVSCLCPAGGSGTSTGLGVQSLTWVGLLTLWGL